MSGNTFGHLFSLTTFGESHGPALGGVVHGCPAGLHLDEAAVQQELDRRRPGQGKTSTPRRESDTVQLLSGIFEGVTTGTPIGFSIANENQRTSDYEAMRGIYRPGHADFTYMAKYGHRDHRGGGRSSGRETVSRVVGGAIAQVFLAQHNIQAQAYTQEFGGIQAETIAPDKAHELPYFAPDPSVVELWDKRVSEIKKAGDTLGGIVEIQIHGVPPGLGEPVFDKLDARLAAACMSVGAVKSVEIGCGRQAARLTGSENNEPPDPALTHRNNAGGILGGISNGAPIVLRAAVKPIPSIAQEQEVATAEKTLAPFTIGGRHDISAIPRIVPVLKAMALLTIADMLLLQRSARSEGSPPASV